MPNENNRQIIATNLRRTDGALLTTYECRLAHLRTLARELIAEAEGISQKYLEAIMVTLSKAGFVDAVHGKGGGYRLNRKPEEYTVGSILKLTEGGLTAVSCTSQGASACSRSECCNTLPMWEKLDKLINDFFEDITIADLLNDTKEV